MASAFAHGLFSGTLGKLISTKPLGKKLWSAILLSSVIPDLDSIGFKFGVSYSSMFGHRGFTHSIFFASLWSLLLVVLFFRQRNIRFMAYVLIFTGTLSHGFLDAMTNGGLGVGFLIPFDSTRYFFPFRPIKVAPISISRFFEQASPILLNEFIWIGLPCLLLLFVLARVRKN